MLFVAVRAGISSLRVESSAAQPMLNPSPFRNVTFSCATISTLLSFVPQYVMVFLTPFYLPKVLHYAPNNAGLVITSFPLAVMAVAPSNGSLSDRIGTRVLACLGAAICALSLFFMNQLPISASSADVVWTLALFGLGTGIFQSPNNRAVTGGAPKPHLSIASGILATVGTVGTVLGIAAEGVGLYALGRPLSLKRLRLRVPKQQFSIRIRVCLHSRDDLDWGSLRYFSCQKPEEKTEPKMPILKFANPSEAMKPTAK